MVGARAKNRCFLESPLSVHSFSPTHLPVKSLLYFQHLKIVCSVGVHHQIREMAQKSHCANEIEKMNNSIEKSIKKHSGIINKKSGKFCGALIFQFQKVPLVHKMALFRHFLCFQQCYWIVQGFLAVIWVSNNLYKPNTSFNWLKSPNSSQFTYALLLWKSTKWWISPYFGVSTVLLNCARLFGCYMGFK